MADTENDHLGADWTNTQRDTGHEAEANPILPGQTSTEDGARDSYPGWYRRAKQQQEQRKQIAADHRQRWLAEHRTATERDYDAALVEESGDPFYTPGQISTMEEFSLQRSADCLEWWAESGVDPLSGRAGEFWSSMWSQEPQERREEAHRVWAAHEETRKQKRHDQLVAEEAERLRARQEAARQVAATSDDDEPEPGDDLSTGGWAPEDLTDILDGNYEPELPKLLPRTDGVALLYPRRVHSLHGESESGKSMIAQAETARVLVEGGTVTYVDFESDAQLVVAGRLLPMGVPRDAIRQRFRYLRPQFDYGATLESRAAFKTLISQPADLCVIDGVTEALVTFGKAGRDENEFTDWFRRLPKKVARVTGAAVVLIDHVTKDREKRGRFALGSQAKMGALDGAAYTVEVKRALGQGMEGLVELRVGKDRPGQVRPNCGAWQKDHTQLAAWVWVDSTDRKTIKVKVDPPGQDDDGGDGQQAKKTPARQKVEAALQAANGDPWTVVQIVGWIEHNCGQALRRETVQKELGLLVGEHHRVKPGSKRGQAHTYFLDNEGDDQGGDDVRRCPGCSKPLPGGTNFCRACAGGLDKADRDARRDNDGYRPY